MRIAIGKVRVALILLAVCAGWAAFSLKPAQGTSAPSDGEDLFRSNCSICHGADGGGDTAMGKKLKIPDLRSSEVQSQSDEDLATIIRSGKGKMPAFEKKLDRERIGQIVAYLRRLAQK
jgi:mono/diheme cytochrome c family protein